MSEDEVFVLIACSIVSLLTWLPWLWHAAFTARRCSKLSHRWGLYAFPLLCAAVLAAVLRLYSSWDVKSNPTYIVFYLVMGAA